MLAGNADIHKSLDEIKIRPNLSSCVVENATLYKNCFPYPNRGHHYDHGG